MEPGPRRRASTPPSAITDGYRRRRRNAWSVSGRYGKANSKANNIAAGRSLHAAENQETRRALLARRFGVIPRAGEIRPSVAPIFRALRGPREIGRLDEMPQGPGGIVGNVGDEAHVAAAPQDAGELRDRRVLDKAAFPVPPFWPRIGMDQVDACQRRVRQPCDQACGVVK